MTPPHPECTRSVGRTAPHPKGLRAGPPTPSCSDQQPIDFALIFCACGARQAQPPPPEWPQLQQHRRQSQRWPQARGPLIHVRGLQGQARARAVQKLWRQLSGAGCRCSRLRMSAPIVASRSALRSHLPCCIRTAHSDRRARIRRCRRRVGSPARRGSMRRTGRGCCRGTSSRVRCSMQAPCCWARCR